MLMLVLGENMLVTFLGWEGVGTCSYLLISFWHERESAATAGKKAFVTNRVGDWGFMLAMFFAFQAIGTLSYSVSTPRRAPMAQTTATAIALFAFVGACGKSAQLPLYLWLPDAMEGPTPVSALIHAATMVTAGVFLMCRISPVLDAASSYAPTLIAIIGVATALFAATIAVAQNDIKKVLAYSTISQLGYMFLAVGSGAYIAAIFHMVTHAFFKALLFLGSGSVIHGMHDEQDMRRMGALRKCMPVTAATFIVGWLAIAGVPPFAGFWSKDDILLAAYDKSPVLWALGLVTALLTAYYMTRQVIMVFYGEARWHDHADEHGAPRRHAAAREPGRSCCCRWWCWPACRSSAAAINLPFSRQRPRRSATWLEPVRRRRTTATPAEACRWRVDRHRRSPSLGIVASAYMVYAKQQRPRPIEPAVLAEGWYYDKAVTTFMGGPGREALRGRRLVRRATSSTARSTASAGWSAAPASGSARSQSGNVRNYAAGDRRRCRAAARPGSSSCGGSCDARFPILTALVLVPRPGRSGRGHLPAAAPSGSSCSRLLTSVLTGGAERLAAGRLRHRQRRLPVRQQAPWIKPWGISWHLGVDGISLFLVVLTGVLFPLVDRRHRPASRPQARTWRGCCCSRPA